MAFEPRDAILFDVATCTVLIPVWHPGALHMQATHASRAHPHAVVVAFVSPANDPIDDPWGFDWGALFPNMRELHHLSGPLRHRLGPMVPLPYTLERLVVSVPRRTTFLPPPRRQLRELVVRVVQSQDDGAELHDILHLMGYWGPSCSQYVTVVTPDISALLRARANIIRPAYSAENGRQQALRRAWPRLLLQEISPTAEWSTIVRNDDDVLTYADAGLWDDGPIQLGGYPGRLLLDGSWGLPRLVTQLRAAAGLRARRRPRPEAPEAIGARGPKRPRP